MKILRVKYFGLSLFEGEVEINFTATDRVEKGSLNHIHSSIYTQNILAISGLNATGKTTLLKLIRMALQIVINKADLNEFEVPHRFFREPVVMEVVFSSENELYQLRSEIALIRGNADRDHSRLVYVEETLLIKKLSSVRSRTMLFDFSGSDVQKIVRSEMKPETKRYIKDDTSIVVGVQHDLVPPVHSLIEQTNVYFHPGTPSQSAIHLFDESIEYIQAQSLKGNDDAEMDIRWNVKFSEDKEVHSFSDLYSLSTILSSGTVRGMNVLSQAMECLENGGYQLIDEMENHLNKRLIRLIMDLYMNRKLNKKGAVLVLSTHYLELLDFLERKDQLYILTRDTSSRTKVRLFSEEIKRNDLKKSDILQAGKIAGTAPKYEAVQAFHRDLMKSGKTTLL